MPSEVLVYLWNALHTSNGNADEILKWRKIYYVVKELYLKNLFLRWNRLQEITKNSNFSWIFKPPVVFQLGRFGKNRKKHFIFLPQEYMIKIYVEHVNSIIYTDKIKNTIAKKV